MIWLLRDFDLLAVLLHALTLSLEALAVGGVAFLLLARGLLSAAVTAAEVRAVRDGCYRLLRGAALGLAIATVASMAVTAMELTHGSGQSWHDLLSAVFLQAESCTVLLSITLALMAWKRVPAFGMLPVALGLTGSVVVLSHAMARMDHRALLALMTLLHHLGTAAWIGAMPYLLLSLRRLEADDAERIIRRFSRMAMAGVAVLTAAGVVMAWSYVGAVSGLYGTAYGLLLLGKIYLLLLMLTLGGANWYLQRNAGAIPMPLLVRLRRFSEVEIGLGFMVLLAAASMTAQAPAVDVTENRVTGADLQQRFAPVRPRLQSPALATLAPPAPMEQAIQVQQYSGLSASDAKDMAWSEYNHHWAGLVVGAAGVLALLSRLARLRWARYWPLVFFGLAAFILLRADPEAWPLGPRGFWPTFAEPDVLEHRLYALLIVVFAVFETAVQAGWRRFAGSWASLVFPVICILGGALLLTHSHGMDNSKDEVMMDASHGLLALLGATAGWARWLELRLPAGRSQRWAGVLFPVALTLVGVVLVNYREA